MKVLNIATVIFIILLCAVVVVATANLPYWSENTPGPAFVPRWVSMTGIFLAILLLVATLRRKEIEEINWPKGESLRRVLLTVTMLWLLMATLPWLGFVLSGTLFMLTMLLFVQRQGVLPALVTTAVAVSGGYLIFIKWLAVDLPKGPFGL